MRNTIIKLLMAFSATAAFTGCDDFLSEYSQDQIVARKVQDLDDLLLGDGYLQSASIPSGPSVTRVAGFMNILDDDVNTGRDIVDSLSESSSFVAKAWVQSLISMYGYFGWQQDVGGNYEGTNINDDAATWDEFYKHINVVNVILNEITDLPHSTKQDSLDYCRVQGEALFIRAQLYFTLVNLYADAYQEATAANALGVPLKLTPHVEFEFTRASVKEVYDQIVSDLTQAERYLTLSPQTPSNYLHRASVEAVDLLLSRVYLYMQNWQLAADKAKAVQDSPNFYLASLTSLDSETAFLTRENGEIIFSQGSNNLASTDIFTGRPGDYCVSNDLYSLYDDDDRRKQCFFKRYTDDPTSAILCDSVALNFKYERGNSLRSHVSDCFTLRMSEAWLNRMEALAMLGQTAEANSLLNEFRAERIGKYAAQSYSADELVRQIRDERRKELCFEGHRWFDLRRYAVNATSPFTKTLVHVYNVCNDYGWRFPRTLVLPPHDQSYTLAIPKSVVDFFTDGSMPTNPRQKREPLESASEGDSAID